MWVNDMEKNENKYFSENYYNANTILKFLRKVLNEINKSYVDSGMRTAFLMKRYLEKYKIDEERCHEHVLLCMLKDIGLFYMDGAVPSNDPALAAASSYAFLHQCSPLEENARPLLFYKAKYMEDVNNRDYDLGLLMTLLYQVSLYIYQHKDVDEIEELLKEERKNKTVSPEQAKKVIKLLRESPDIIEKLNSQSELYVYETSRFISLANYPSSVLTEFLDTTSYMFEFHNHETLAHTVTTAQIAYDLAKACKLTESTSCAIEIAGKVHDIGKIRVPLDILCYPGKLEGEALAEMQNHAKYTKDIIEGCFSYVIVEIASRHHEKLDGSGYPLGLTRRDLTSADKVLAVADICSALYCKRSYKASFTPEKIQAILLSDAKAGKLDERIVNHLIDDYDNIMANAKLQEENVLKIYNTMKAEYEALAQSPALRHVFGESEEVSSHRPESVAADETEEYISGVINYGKKKPEEVQEQIIYVDEDGNEIDYNPEDGEIYVSEDGEVVFEVQEEKPMDPLEEYNQSEMGDVEIEQIKSDFDEEDEAVEEDNSSESGDDFETFLNTIPEEKEEREPKKAFVPKAPLKKPTMNFDPFKEEIDPVFQEPIIPKDEEDEEFDAFLNTIPEETEEDEFDAFLESIPEKEEVEEVFVEEDDESTFDEDTTVESSEDEEFDAFLSTIPEETEEDEFDAFLESIPEKEVEESYIEETTLDQLEEEYVPEEETYTDNEEEIDDITQEDIILDEAERVDPLLEEAIQAEKEQEEFEAMEDQSDSDDEDTTEMDDAIYRKTNDFIDSKYDIDPDEEIDYVTNSTDETDEEESIIEDEETYDTSFEEDEEFDDVVDDEEEIIPDESKYDLDPDEEIDDTTYNLDSEEPQEESDYDMEPLENETSDELEKNDELEESNEPESMTDDDDDYVTTYVTEDEFDEEEPQEESENKKEYNEDDYVTTYVTEDEFDDEEDEETSTAIEEQEPLESESFDEDNLQAESDSLEEQESLELNTDSDFDDEDDEDEFDDEDDDEDDDEEDEVEDSKHKKFFSQDIYRKMFTYNPNNKKKK